MERNFWEARKGFDSLRFEEERFGVGRGKMGFRDWNDVAYYYGISPTNYCNPINLRNGDMSNTLYECLCRTYGQEAVDDYFPKEVKPKPSKEDKEIEDLCTLMCGSVSDVNAMRKK